MKTNSDVAVVGGGPAGMMAAASAARAGASTVLLEKNDKLGKKLFLTGHGRCNVTNRGDIDTYLKRIWRNPKFMRSALHAFSPSDLEDFLAENGVRLKEEDSGRMFPVSDRSSDIIKALSQELKRDGVDVHLGRGIESIAGSEPGFVLTAGSSAVTATSVVIATGGLSYPSTGSTGDGYRFARALGHELQPTGPALVGFYADTPSDLAGITLSNASLSVFSGTKRLVCEKGSILFTHTGLGGPTVFRASCAIAPGTEFPLTAKIDLKPDVSEEEVSAQLMDLLTKGAGRQAATVLEGMIPRRLAAHLLRQAGIDPQKRVNQITRSERRALCEVLKGYRIELTNVRPISEAIITQGGIPVSEIDPRTMQSRIVPGLFFAGEVVDVSAMTGGYNLQIAFSMGWKAGREAAQYARGA